MNTILILLQLNFFFKNSLVFFGLHFGFIFCNYYSKYLIKQKLLNLELSIIDDLITWLIVAVLLGGRLGYVIFYNFDFYFSNPLEILKIWQGGMSFHGALIGVIVLIIFFKNKKN